MTHFMRNFRRFNKSSLLRSVAIAVPGSTLLCCNNNYDIRASVAARFPLSLQDYFPSTCPVQNDLCPQLLHFPSISGLFPLNSYRVSPVPLPYITKESSGAVHDGSKPRGCFSRDSIATNIGLFPLNSYRLSPVPLPYITKEYSGAVHDGSKPCGCFGRDSIANAAAKVGPAVVNIVVPQEFHAITAGKGIGSGTIINKDGTILTCAHVVVDFQGTRSSLKGKVEVTLQDGRTFVGKVIHADQHSDIAIVKINSETPLPEAKLGSSSRLRPGDWVIAMGCPLSLQNTVTAGIVSCVDRKSSYLGFMGMQRGYLQTDCVINLGNCGGPLVNIDGEVVGVNIMKVLAADGLGFSVAIDSVCKIIEHFNKSGRVIRPWLGLKMRDLNEMIIAQQKKIDASFPSVDKGILVPMVIPRSPGDRAGFRPGDVIVEFDGKPVESIKEVMEIMGDKAGVPMKAVIKRANDKSVTLTVIPEESNLEI